MNEDAMMAAIESAEGKLSKLDDKKDELEHAIALKKAQIRGLEEVLEQLGSVEEQAGD